MHDWFRLDAEAIWGLGGPLIPIAGAALVAAFALVPPDRRRTLNRMLLAVAVFAAMAALEWALPPRDNLRWIRVVSIGALLVILARSVVVLATESRPGRWLIPPLPRIVADVIQGAVYAGVVLLTLHAAGMEPASLLTTSALLTAVIGLALQETLGNLFAGLSLQIAKPFVVGDWVDVEAGPRQSGRITEIGWRATRILTLDDIEVIVPNNVLGKSILRNATRPTPVARRNIDFAASYEHAPDHVHAVVLAALEGVPNVLHTPAPSVVTADFAADGVRYTLRYYTDDQQAATVTDSALRDRIWHTLRRAGIAMPFPQREIRIVSDAAKARNSADLSERERALRHVPLFDVLSPEVHLELASSADTQRFTAGEAVVRQGEPGDTLYVVLEGRVAVEVANPDGGPPVRVATLAAGEFFGEMSLMTGEVRSATVRAEGACRLVRVGHDALRAVLVAHPEVAERLCQVLAARNEAREAQLEARPMRPPAMMAERSSVLLGRIRAFFEG